MKVHLASCGDGPNAWREKTELLAYYHSVADEKKHELVSEPEQADIIVISNLRDEDWHAAVVNHPLRRRYPHKCFGIEDGDFPVPLLRGIYTSASSKAWNFGRVRSGSYGLFLERWRNRAVESQAEARTSAPKRYLFSFIGRANHPVRQVMLQNHYRRADIRVEETGKFSIFTADNPVCRAERERFFADVLMASKFALCPRGIGTSSIRLFEAISLGIAPVIISDRWMPPEGPDWESFSIRVRERDVARVEEIVAEREAEWEEMGQRAQAAHDEFFSSKRYFNFVIDSLVEIREGQRVPERAAQLFWHAYLKYLQGRAVLMRATRGIIWR
jgi:hypothetical protein